MFQLRLRCSCPQAVLSCKPDGDSRLLELRRHSEGLLEQPDLEEHVKQQVHHTVQDSEEQWRRVLQSAEDHMKKAEVQYSLSRELQAFRNQAKSTSCWVKELQQQAGSKGSGTQGSRAQIEDRLSTAQVGRKMSFILSRNAFLFQLSSSENVVVSSVCLELQVQRRSSSHGSEEASGESV